MTKKSAGLLVYRTRNSETEVLLVHPGGPFFAKKDLGSWGIPKGEFTDEEEALDAARREFTEETNTRVDGIFRELKPIKLKSGKMIYAWAIHAEPDLTSFQSNTFTMEWPPNSGEMKEFPEVDKAEWFTLEEAKNKISEGQQELIKELENILNNSLI